MTTKKVWPDDYRSWTGNFEELVQEAGSILAQINPEGGVPTSSLVRYYQQHGAVGRGKKTGRASNFRYEDLARVVATKQMANQQVPISISKEMLSNTPVDTIVRNSGISANGLHGSPAAATSVALANYQGGNEAERTVAKLLASSCYGTANVSPHIHTAFASMTSSIPAASQTIETVLAAAPATIDLPPGGVLRYTLAGGIAIEIPAQSKQRKTQANALREFADQIDPPPHPPTRST